jgi:DNA-binding NarL/FixJ family response regulator
VRGQRFGALVVDDEPDMRALVRAVLDTADDGLYVCGEAADGETAVAQAMALDPAVVVLDRRLPGIDGIEAARRIRAHRPDQTIVLFSAYLDEDARRDAEDAGIARCVSKGDVNLLPDLVWEAVRS